MRTSSTLRVVVVALLAGGSICAHAEAPTATAGSSAPTAAAGGPVLVREGKRLVDAPGLLRIQGDAWVFETVTEGRRRSFSLMPSLKLGELEQVAAARGEGEYRVSGRVYVYQRRNFLLVESFSSVGEREEAQQAESATGAPSVADLIREFEQSRADRNQQRSGPGERRGEAVALRREGTQLTLAKGR